MAFKGVNEETLAALQEQGGAEFKGASQNDATVIPVKETPEIKVVDPEILKADEARKINEAAEAKVKLEAEEAAKLQAQSSEEGKKKLEQEVIDFNDDTTVNKVVEESGLDLNDIKSQIIKDGGITDTTKEMLKEKIDPALVDAYVESFEKQLGESKAKPEPKVDTAQEAINKAQLEMNDYIFNSVGGKDTFEVLASTINEGATKTEVGKINAKLASTNKDLVTEGLNDAVKIYNKLTGRGNKLMTGDANAETGVETFKFVTKAQYLKQITTEKYKTDPAYAKKVDDARMKSIEMDKAQTMPGQYRNIRDGKMYNL